MSSDTTIRHYKGDTKLITFKITEPEEISSAAMDIAVDITGSTFKIFMKSLNTGEIAELVGIGDVDNRQVAWAVPSATPIGMYRTVIEETKLDGTKVRYPRHPLRPLSVRVIDL